MYGMKPAQAISVLVALWFVLGCSGLSSLFLRNETNEPLTLDLRIRNRDGGPKEVATKRIQMDRKSTTAHPIAEGFTNLPQLDIKVVSKGIHSGKSFVVPSRVTSSDATDYTLVIDDSGVRYADPGFFDRSINMTLAVASSICCGLPIVGVLIVVALLALRRRLHPSD